MLTVDLTAYDGDPNALTAPTIVQDAPKGTFYLRDSTGILYQKGYNTPGTYRAVGSGPGPTPVTDRLFGMPLNGIKDGVNTVFYSPDKFIYGTECLYLGGMRLSRGPTEDYIAEESGGSGTGYDRIVFAFAPFEEENIVCDYSIVAPIKFKFGIQLLGTKDGVNLVFTTPETFIPNTECVYWNGTRLAKGEDPDYTIEESGGLGSGYDTIVLSIAPILGEALEADYSTV
jgi:hypothetical protein